MHECIALLTCGCTTIQSFTHSFLRVLNTEEKTTAQKPVSHYTLSMQTDVYTNKSHSVLMTDIACEFYFSREEAKLKQAKHKDRVEAFRTKGVIE